MSGIFVVSNLEGWLKKKQKKIRLCQEPTLIEMAESRKVPTKYLFEQEAPKTETQKCSTKRGVREPLYVEFAKNNREMVKAEVFEKRVFEQTTPIKMKR